MDTLLASPSRAKYEDYINWFLIAVDPIKSIKLVFMKLIY